jgi:hypothetical protein
MIFERNIGKAKQSLEEITGTKTYCIEGKWENNVWIVECLEMGTHKSVGFLHSLNKFPRGLWMASEKKEHTAEHALNGGQ